MRGVKTKARNRWKRSVIFCVLVILLVMLLNSVTKVYQKDKDASEALARMEQEQKDLAEREQFLRESLERLSTQDGLEFEIRRKLNVAKVGESVAIIVEKTESSPNNSSHLSFWQKIKNLFGSLFR